MQIEVDFHDLEYVTEYAYSNNPLRNGSNSDTKLKPQIGYGTNLLIWYNDCNQ